MPIAGEMRTIHDARNSRLEDGLVGQDGAIADLVFLHLFDGFIGLGHGEGLGLALTPWRAATSSISRNW